MRKFGAYALIAFTGLTFSNFTYAAEGEDAGRDPGDGANAGICCISTPKHEDPKAYQDGLAGYITAVKRVGGNNRESSACGGSYEEITGKSGSHISARSCEYIRRVSISEFTKNDFHFDRGRSNIAAARGSLREPGGPAYDPGLGSNKSGPAHRGD